jgi:hypothetical protein
MKSRARITVVSTRKLIIRVYVIPVLVIISLFIAFIWWAVTPVQMPYVGLKRTAGNLGHIQIRYNLDPNSYAHVTLDEHASCRLMDRSVYHSSDSYESYYYVNCDGRVGYVRESNLRW